MSKGIYISIVIVILNLIWLNHITMEGHDSGDALVLAMHSEGYITGQVNNTAYPLFMVIPATLTLVLGNSLTAVQLSPLFFAVIYISGMIVVSRVLTLTTKQSIIVCVLASLPALPPYETSFSTLYVAAFYPWTLALILYVMGKRNLILALTSGLFIAAALPLLHLQLSLAVFITIAFLSIFNLKNAFALRYTVYTMGTLLVWETRS